MKQEDMIGRPLGEVMEELRKETGSVKIGCKQSSAFVYCGHKVELTPYALDRVDRIMKDFMVERVMNDQYRINGKMNSFPTVADYVKSCWKKNETFGSLKGYVSTLYEHWKALGVMKASLTEKRKQLDSRIPLKDRPILEVNKSIVALKQIIIMVDGYETTGCWDVGEYEDFLRHKRISLVPTEDELKDTGGDESD